MESEYKANDVSDEIDYLLFKILKKHSQIVKI